MSTEKPAITAEQFEALSARLDQAEKRANDAEALANNLQAEMTAKNVAMAEVGERRKNAMVETAQKDGRVTPKMLESVKEYASVATVEALENFLGALESAIEPNTEGGEGKQGDDDTAPSGEDEEIAKLFGVKLSTVQAVSGPNMRLAVAKLNDEGVN